MKIGISMDPELYEWLLSRTGAGREFASISHAVSRSVASYAAAQHPRAGDERAAVGTAPAPLPAPTFVPPRPHAPERRPQERL